jgi:hypothetical protein
LLQDRGIGAERIPLSGSCGGKFSGDLSIPICGRDLTVEAKSRGSGFKQIYSWLKGRDALIVRADRQNPLLIVPLKLAAEVVLAAERGSSDETLCPGALARRPSAILDDHIDSGRSTSPRTAATRRSLPCEIRKQRPGRNDRQIRSGGLRVGGKNRRRSHASFSELFREERPRRRTFRRNPSNRINQKIGDLKMSQVLANISVPAIDGFDECDDEPLSPVAGSPSSTQQPRLNGGHVKALHCQGGHMRQSTVAKSSSNGKSNEL